MRKGREEERGFGSKKGKKKRELSDGKQKEKQKGEARKDHTERAVERGNQGRGNNTREAGKAKQKKTKFYKGSKK